MMKDLVLVFSFLFLAVGSLASPGCYCVDHTDGYNKADTIISPAHPLIAKDQDRYAVKAVDFNSTGMDFSPHAFRNGIVFVSSRSKKGVVQEGDDVFLNLFYTQEGDDGSFSSAEALNTANISAYHEGPAVFYQNGSKMIFTRNAFVKKSKLRAGSVNSLELAHSELTATGKWTEPVPLTFAGPEYSVAHPAINEGGTTLYFSSNMPGTLGQSDLFVSHLQNGAWTKPENLGGSVNTVGQELFPFVYKDSILFFASNGHGGAGGLDMFFVKLKDPKRTIFKMEAPVNSPADDFGIYIERDGVSGFFSSNREGSAGQDDIYYFEEIRAFAEMQLYDSLTRRVIACADLELHQGLTVNEKIKSDLSGRAAFRVRPSLQYQLSISAPGYDSKVIDLKAGTWSMDQRGPLRIYLQPLMHARNEKHFSGLQTSDRTGLTNVISFTSSPLDVDVVSESAGLPPVEEPKEIPDSPSAHAIKVIAVEIINEVPAILIIKNDSIHMLKNVAEATLENSELGLRIEIPQGAKRHVYEEIIRKEIAAQGYDIGRFLLIRSFFFDSGKTWVRNDASAQLDKIIEVMVNHRELVLQMTFHSDSRGTEKFNLDLSKARADEVSAYLAKAGIKGDRIITKFVGESQLLNNCGDLADCGEMLHQINRTAEFNFILR